jgi:hypothetical protein
MPFKSSTFLSINEYSRCSNVSDSDVLSHNSKDQGLRVSSSAQPLRE